MFIQFPSYTFLNDWINLSHNRRIWNIISVLLNCHRFNLLFVPIIACIVSLGRKRRHHESDVFKDEKESETAHKMHLVTHRMAGNI